MAILKCRDCGEPLRFVKTPREKFALCNVPEVEACELPDGMALVVDGRIVERPAKDARGYVLHRDVCRGKR